ncbi:Calcipressin-domain-containing protein [Lactarius indigo]|nr:Calcipressin-domain-containing protein [Lactarius indigo]
MAELPTPTEDSKRTNTLVLTQLPTPFFHPRVMDALRDPFRFLRVIVVYESEDSADEAKSHSDGLHIDATPETPAFVLRVFRADPTPATPPGGAHLRPPAIEKNFLISPPGSPPVGWEQVVEEPPNSTPLAEDLIAALRKLQLTAGTAGGGREMLARSGGRLRDCDMLEKDLDEEPDWVYGEDNPTRLVYKPIPTALPPISPRP